MQLSPQLCHADRMRCLTQCQCVLCHLQLEVGGRRAMQQCTGLGLVMMRQHCGRSFSSVQCQQRVDVMQCTYVVVATVKGFSDVPVNHQTGVQCVTRQLHGVPESPNCPCDIQATRCWHPLMLSSRAKPTAAVCVGLRSNPFSKNQCETSATHSEIPM